MRGDEEVRAMLAEAAAVLRAGGAPLEESLEQLGLPGEAPSREVAHALGIVEGAAVALGVTALELLSEYRLLTGSDLA